MSISIDLIKQLRDESMASLKDCKECLIEANGDLAIAKELLKKKGLAAASKKSDREVKEGLIKFDIRNNKIVGLALGCETDFVAKNEMFISTMDNILTILSDLSGDFDGSLDLLNQETIDIINSNISELIGKLGENMKVVFIVSKSLGSNKAYIYTHLTNKLVSTIVYNELSQDAPVAAKMLAIQLAAMNAQYVRIEDIEDNTLQTMKSEAKDELLKSGKPESVVDNIVTGKMNKRYSENVLLEQGYVGDETMKMKNIIGDKFELVSASRYSI